ncbi:MAG: Lrp/AsnC family transcriptional regulator [Desulfovibrio sp.]|nr:Lrp/AsnC family transcriptional regulator [Desulfovibrio sp.]
MRRQFSNAEQAVLRIVQDNLPDSLTPYADIARQTEMTEDEVIQLLVELKENGAIRRFGASIRHQRTGWAHNAMVGWKVRPDQVEECGTRAARHEHVSHVYYRPSPAADWPYELYTMIHGHSESECRRVVDDIMKATSLREYAVLRTLRELKKISMTYFA